MTAYHSVESIDEAIQLAHRHSLKIHNFKKKDPPARVSKVLGILKGLNPSTILDVGSGRGVFLWPLVLAFPEIKISVIDINKKHTGDISAVSQGGINNLTAYTMSVLDMDFPDNFFDVVTLLEVLEHIEDTFNCLKEIIRVAKEYVILSVPSKMDDNEEHIHFFTPSDLRKSIADFNVKKIEISHVLNHIIIVIKK